MAHLVGDATNCPPGWPAGDAWVVFGARRCGLCVGMEVEVAWPVKSVMSSTVDQSFGPRRCGLRVGMEVEVAWPPISRHCPLSPRTFSRHCRTSVFPALSPQAFSQHCRQELSPSRNVARNPLSTNGLIWFETHKTQNTTTHFKNTQKYKTKQHKNN